MAVWAAIAAILAPRPSAETHAKTRNAHYIIARDMRLFGIAAHIVSRLTDEGWENVEVRESPLITFTIVAYRHLPGKGTCRCSYRVGRSILLDFGKEFAECLVWLFEKQLRRSDQEGK